MSDRDHTLIPLRPWRAIDDVVYDAGHNEILRCPSQHIARAVADAMNSADELEVEVESERDAAESWKSDSEIESARAEEAKEQARELKKQLADVTSKLDAIRALVRDAA